MNLIEAFRLRGHLRANLCPIGFLERPEVPDLDPRAHGLTDADLEREFAVGGMYGVERMKLKDLVARAKTARLNAGSSGNGTPPKKIESGANVRKVW